MRRRPLVAAMAAVMIVGAVVGSADVEATPTGPGPGPGPTLSVTPDTDLVDGQVVTVSGTGWVADRSLSLRLCGADPAACPVPDTSVRTDGAGSFSTEVRVRAAYAFAGRSTDCRHEACSVDARQSSSTAEAPVSFDPDAPLVPPPVLTVSDDDDLIHRQEVVVTGSGFFPDEELIVSQCFDGVAALPMPYCGTSITTADGTGAFVDTVLIQDRKYQPRAEHDCRGTPSPCPITVASGHPPYRVRATVDIGLRPEAPEAVTVTPTTGLRHGQSVEVRATGLNANHDAVVGQCYVDERGVEGACGERFRPFSAGPDGRLSETFAVRRTWYDEYNDRAVDCAVLECRLIVTGDAVHLAVGPSDGFRPTVRIVVPLSFAAGAEAPVGATPQSVEPRFTG